MNEPEISFITINYNSSHYTIKLLESIQKNTSLSYEVIVIDNASSLQDYDQLLNFTSKCAHVKLVRNRINSGFAGGNMLGVNYARGKYYFFINNDTELLNDCSFIFKEYFEQYPNVALATAKVKDEHGNFSSSYKLFPSVLKELLGNTLARKLNKHHFPSNKVKLEEPSLVEVVSGSCMFFKAKDFQSIGGFDTLFFLYCEEEDISKRLWNAGKHVVFLPEAEIFHASGGSTQRSFDILKEFDISYNHLINKHFSFFPAVILKTLRLTKLLRRSFKSLHHFQLFLFGLSGYNNKHSLRFKQKVVDAL
ncbi:MAG: glycosyltransferase family 2 protein [Arcobacteraceae bacterium]|jgi:GT2 family glycosyltransferase